MKKILLTTCAAALLGLAAYAQEEQDTTQSNQYRPIPQEEDTTDYMQEPIDPRQDTADIDQRNQFRNESLEQTENNLDSTFNDLNEELEEEEQNIRDESDQAEQNIEEGGQDIEQGAENVEQNAREAGQDMERSAEDSLQQDGGQPQSDMNQNESGKGAQAGITTEEIQVVEGKEGPNNEVVYEIDGDMFYVDREKKELVKVKKSDLKDSKHEVEVKEGTASGDDSKMKNKKSKG